MDQPVVSRILPSGRNVVAATLAVTLMMPNAAAFAFSGTPSNGQSTNADAFSAASLASSDQQNQIDELESASNQAKAEFDSADAPNQQAQADLAAAQKKRDDAASSLSDAQAKDTSAQAALKSAQDAQTQADKDRTSAAAGVSSASTAVDSAKQSTQAKQSALDTAKSAQVQADSVNATAQSKVATAQQAASQAQAAYDAAKANEGTVEDFFTSLGDSSANDLINNCKYASSTHLDQANDATSLDNVAQSFQFIKECNAIRKANGLSKLKVTSGMMAMAIADCNWSSTNIAHAKQFNVGENLAWGYGTSAYRLNDSSNLSSNSNPFNGWYDVEKNIYDTGADGVTGHYENIVDTSYTVTGFSYRTGGTYPTTFGQTFSWSSGSYKSYTVSEYEVLFNAWRESRTASEKKALELANAGVTAAQEAASVTQAQADSAASATQKAQESYNESLATQKKAEEQLTAAQATSTSAQSAYEAAQASVSSAQAAKEQADKDLAAAQETYDSADAAYGEAKKKADSAAEQAASAEAAYNNAYASFAAACVQESSQFSDVDTGAWYAMGVGYCAGKGLFAGYAGTTLFGVGDSMTRAQLAVVLWRHFDPEDAAVYSEDEAVGTDTVAGIEDHRFYTGAANWAVEKGVINGKLGDDGQRDFAPNDQVTFEQLIAIIANASGEDFESTSTGLLDRFTDSDAISDWARAAMAWAVDKGLVNGSENADGSRSILPGANAARERTATVLMNAFQAGVLQ